MDPRSVVPASIMPAYPWLAERAANADGDIVQKLRALKYLGHPYDENTIENAQAALEGKTELDAMITYLQGMGLAFGQGDRP